MTDNQRGVLSGIIIGLVLIIGQASHWPMMLTTALAALLALGVLRLMGDRITPQQWVGVVVLFVVGVLISVGAR